MIPPGTPLRLTRVPASRGLLWMRRGFQVYLQRPFVFTGLLASVLIASMLLSLLPVVGVIVLSVCLPLLTLAFMVATRVVLEGGTPTRAQLTAPLAIDPLRRGRLLKLGVTYAVATIAIAVLSSWIDGGALLDALEASIDRDGVGPALSDPQLQIGLLLRFGLLALLSIPFWHAPALIWWGGQGVGQALFSSTLACWRARGAFLVYGLAWTLLIVLFSMMLALIVGLFGSREVLGLAAIPAGLIFTTAFYTSLYFTFADSFSAEPREGAGSDGDASG